MGSGLNSTYRIIKKVFSKVKMCCTVTHVLQMLCCKCGFERSQMEELASSLLCVHSTFKNKGLYVEGLLYISILEG